MFKKSCRAIVALFIGATISMASSAQANPENNTFSPQQQQEIQKIVRDYLINNPEVLVEVSQSLQDKELSKAKSQALQGITSNKEKLFNDPASPSTGNTNGDVMIVEFFDYQCGHCKEMQPVIESLLAKNKNVKIIYKEFPIYGASSNFASKAALAAAKQNKYLEFHNALFKVSGALNEHKVLEVAKSVNLNIDQLKKDMNDPAVKNELTQNYDLAKALSLIGTPSFVLGNKAMTQFDFIPGAVPAQLFQQTIEKIGQNK